MIEHALAYAARGWPVFPLAGKLPRVADWPNAATTDEATLRKWWASWPAAGIGMVTGNRSGVYVVDVDGEEGEASLAELPALPTTRVVVTGSGSRHLWFAHVEGFRNTQSTLGKRIDTRGDGGLVVLPPSVHPDTGATYYGVDESAPVAPMPAWLVERLTRPKVVVPPWRPAPVTGNREERYGQATLAAVYDDITGAAKGTRNGVLYTKARRLGEIAAVCGLREAEAMAALLAAAAAAGLGDRESRKTASSGWRRGLAQPQDIPKPEPRPTVTIGARVVSGPVAQAPRPKDTPAPPATVAVEAGQLARAIDVAEEALVATGGLYQRGESLVRTAWVSGANIGDPDGLRAVTVNQTWLSEHLEKTIRWTRYDAKRQMHVATDVPAQAAARYLARVGQWKLPRLVALAEAPTMRPDGTILQEPGYDAATGLYYEPRDVFPAVADAPTKDDAHHALAVLTEPFEDFPFREPHDLSIALAAVLTSLVRATLPTAPMFAFNAPKMGSGKSLCAGVVSSIAIARRVPMSWSDDANESNKRLLALLMEGTPVITIDNIEAPLEGEALCTVLTEPTWRARFLGETRTVEVPTRVTWLATGNNLVVRGDMCRRLLRCDMDPGVERPEERSFKRSLPRWVPENRGRLVAAALTLLRAYHLAGRPSQGLVTFGSYEDWSDLVRSALVWVGAADPCLALADLRETDGVRLALMNVHEQWRMAFGDTWATVSDAVTRAQGLSQPGLRTALREVADYKGELSGRRLSTWITQYVDRIEAGYVIRRSPRPVVGNAHGYRIERVDWREPQGKVVNLREVAF